MHATCGLDGVDGYLTGAIHAVLEADGHGQTGSHLPMGLRFGGSGPDSGPGYEIGYVLGSNRIQEFCGGRDAEINDVAEEIPGNAQAFVDVGRTIEIWIHDQALPAKGGARFFKIDPHDQANSVIYPFFEIGEAARIFQPGIRIVNRAGPDYQQKPMIVAKDDSVDFLSGLRNEFRLRVRFGDLFYELARCRERGRLSDIDVGGLFHGRDSWRALANFNGEFV